MTKSDRTIENIVGVFLMPIVIPITSVLNGLALAKMWEWFISDTFGVQEISMLQAIGLSMIFGFLTIHLMKSDPDKSLGYLMLESLVRTFITVALYMTFALVLVQFLR